MVLLEAIQVSRFLYLPRIDFCDRLNSTGIQDTPNGHVIIYSLWDPSATVEVTSVLYAEPGATTERFGGEGTGYHFISNPSNGGTGWNLNTWYTLVTRCWDNGQHTSFGLWVFDSVNWHYLVTIDYPYKGARFNYGATSFLENYGSSDLAGLRKMSTQNGWKRSTAGWGYFLQGSFDVGTTGGVSGNTFYMATQKGLAANINSANSNQKVSSICFDECILISFIFLFILSFFLSFFHSFSGSESCYNTASAAIVDYHFLHCTVQSANAKSDHQLDDRQLSIATILIFHQIIQFQFSFYCCFVVLQLGATGSIGLTEHDESSCRRLPCNLAAGGCLGRGQRFADYHFLNCVRTDGVAICCSVVSGSVASSFVWVYTLANWSNCPPLQVTIVQVVLPSHFLPFNHFHQFSYNHPDVLDAIAKCGSLFLADRTSYFRRYFYFPALPTSVSGPGSRLLDLPMGEPYLNLVRSLSALPGKEPNQLRWRINIGNIEFGSVLLGIRSG